MKLTKLLCLFFPLFAIGQGYYNSENFGNRSLLLSGNVTGSVEDLGLTYYNPARIALIESPTFSINAKAYQVSSLALKNVFGQDGKLSDSKFEGVPSLLAGTFDIAKWENHHFAYAFLSRRRTRANINAIREGEESKIVDEVEEISDLVSRFVLDNTNTDEWFGVTWGTKLRDNFSIGVSTFVSVYNYRGRYDLRLAVQDQTNSANFYNNTVNFGQSSYGVFWKIGLAWKLKGFDLGLNVDLPYLEVIKSGKFSYAEILAGTNDDIFKYGKLDDLESNRKEPIAISVGAGIPWKKNTIHLKADWHGAVSEYDRLLIPSFETGEGETEEFRFKEELKSVINFGVGADFFLSERVNLFASFSTDNTPLVTSASIFDFVGEEDSDVNLIADYMHYGLGIDLKFTKAQITIGTTYSVASGDFDRPIDFPDQGGEVPQNDELSQFEVTRWRFIVGLEFPILGYDVNFK